VFSGAAAVAAFNSAAFYNFGHKKRESLLLDSPLFVLLPPIFIYSL